jgi:hypothetical protein
VKLSLQAMNRSRERTKYELHDLHAEVNYLQCVLREILKVTDLTEAQDLARKGLNEEP